MTQSRGRRRFSGRRGPRRAAEWSDEHVNETVLSNDGREVTLLAGVPDDEFKGLTVVRNIIHLVCALAGVSTGGRVSFGLVLVEVVAVAASAFPNPEVEGQQPGWLWRHVDTVSQGIANVRSEFTVIDADIKAKRRYPGEDYRLMLLMAASTTGGGVSVNVDGQVRTLFLKS